MEAVLANGTTGEFTEQLAGLRRQTEVLLGSPIPKMEIPHVFASYAGIIDTRIRIDNDGIVVETDDEGEDYTMDSAQAKAIARALRRTNGNVSQAAKLLGVQRATIYNHARAEAEKKKIA